MNINFTVIALASCCLCRYEFCWGLFT